MAEVCLLTSTRQFLQQEALLAGSVPCLSHSRQPALAQMLLCKLSECSPQLLTRDSCYSSAASLLHTMNWLPAEVLLLQHHSVLPRGCKEAEVSSFFPCSLDFFGNYGLMWFFFEVS